MHKSHQVFEEPTEKARIWRYTDFTKFVSLLHTQQLFFARADKLQDPYEGTYPRASLNLLDGILPPTDLAIFRETLGPSFYENVRKSVFINSWHINEYESAAMWRLYLKTNEGIAIQSTFKLLAESFNVHTEDDVFIGRVKYIDYETARLPASNAFFPFLAKRTSYEHEHELRAVVWKSDYIDLASREREQIPDGIYVSIDLPTVIDKVYVAPDAPQWFNSLVKSVMNKYELSKEIVQSSLGGDPLF